MLIVVIESMRIKGLTLLGTTGSEGAEPLFRQKKIVPCVMNRQTSKYDYNILVSIVPEGRCEVGESSQEPAGR
jgi:hypothetical protein